MSNHKEMAPEQRNQTTVTLSDQANKDFELAAEYLGMPKATLMRQKLEEVHQSPAFGALLKRAKGIEKADD